MDRPLQERSGPCAWRSGGSAVAGAGPSGVAGPGFAAKRPLARGWPWCSRVSALEQSSFPPSECMRIPDPQRAVFGATGPVDLDRLLVERFGIASFHGWQREAIDALLRPSSRVLLVAPTGGGKSLCYQLPAVALD